MTDELDLAALRQQAQEARERAQKAWPLPWRSDLARIGYYSNGAWFTLGVMHSWEGGVLDAYNATFIAAARQDVPTLADAVETLATEVARLQAENAQFQREIGWLHDEVERLSPDRSTPSEPQPRDPACVEAWPECEDGMYDPRCCRFPKSCSCSVRPFAAPSDPTP